MKGTPVPAPAVKMIDVDAACAEMGQSDDGLPAQPSFIHDRVLHIVVASTGQAMMFAAALAERITTALKVAGGPDGRPPSMVMEIMARASDAPPWVPRPPGYMVICFPGVRVDPGDPAARRAAAAARLAGGTPS
jgi:hypothetical protein